MKFAVFSTLFVAALLANFSESLDNTLTSSQEEVKSWSRPSTKQRQRRYATLWVPEPVDGVGIFTSAGECICKGDPPPGAKHVPWITPEGLCSYVTVYLDGDLAEILQSQN